MQIISTMALYNYKVPVIIKKNSVLVNHGKTFQIFLGLLNKIQGLFQDVATLFIS